MSRNELQCICGLFVHVNTCMQLWQFSISDLVPPCGSLWEAIAWSYFLSNSSVCWRVVSQAQHMSYVLKHTRVGVRLIWSDFHSKLLVTIFDSTSLLRKVVTVNVCSCLYICSYGYKLHPTHLGSKVAKVLTPRFEPNRPLFSPHWTMHADC